MLYNLNKLFIYNIRHKIREKISFLWGLFFGSLIIILCPDLRLRIGLFIITLMISSWCINDTLAKYHDFWTQTTGKLPELFSSRMMKWFHWNPFLIDNNVPMDCQDYSDHMVRMDFEHLQSERKENSKSLGQINGRSKLNSKTRKILFIRLKILPSKFEKRMIQIFNWSNYFKIAIDSSIQYIGGLKLLKIRIVRTLLSTLAQFLLMGQLECSGSAIVRF